MRTELGLVLVAAVSAACGEVEPYKQDAAPLPDASVPDAGPTCSDNLKNGTETDTDCGGTCGGCGEGNVCVAASDCSNGSCFGGHCGERMWIVDSTGSNLGIPANQQWTAAPGVSLTFTTYAPSQVFMRWMGTLRYVGGGMGTCHIGMRFLIDGVATGHTSWGDAIVVQRGATRWHEPFLLELTTLLAPGEHTISGEMVNGSGAATCNLDGDTGAVHDRSHLAVAAYDPQASWYAESSASTGALGSASPWTDIPGVAVTIPLTEPAFVQLSLQGSQSTGAVTPGTLMTRGHCAYRFVVDSVPLGDSNHGQAVVVGDTDGGWWSPVGLKWGGELTAGTHPVRVQVRNSASGGGTCEAGQGNHPYSRFRLFATATPVGRSLAVESTGTVQALGPNSAWTAIAGLGAQLVLDSPAPVQIEVAGSQYTGSASATSGHCAYRLVVDGNALGHVDHGQAVNVGDPVNSWWSYYGLLWGAELGVGTHDVHVEARNSSAAAGGQCEVNRDDAGYGRGRLLIRTL